MYRVQWSYNPERLAVRKQKRDEKMHVLLSKGISLTLRSFSPYNLLMSSIITLKQA